ncbi:MAG: hypothetical protein LBU91_06260 [Bacteroidales bacterium]|jgi:hypothetical protein|nr:hypothetical protein [Bacteroidales bacterium]
MKKDFYDKTIKILLFYINDALFLFLDAAFSDKIALLLCYDALFSDKMSVSLYKNAPFTDKIALI